MGRERQQRDPRDYPEEALGALRRSDRDIRDASGPGSTLTAQSANTRASPPPWGNDEEEARRVRDAVREAHRHQPGLDHAGRRLVRSRDERVRVARPHRHRGEKERPREEPPRHPFARSRAAFHVERRVSVERSARGGAKRSRFRPARLRPRPRPLRSPGAPRSARSGDAPVAQAPRRLHDPRIAGLREGDGARCARARSTSRSMMSMDRCGPRSRAGVAVAVAACGAPSRPGGPGGAYPSPHISPTFVARASRCRCDKAHGPKDAEGVADPTSKRLEGVRLVTASRLASAAESW